MGFLSKIRNNMQKRVSRIPSRGRRSVLTGLRIPNRRTPLEDMITSGRLPQPIPRAERMPISNAPSFNPTIFGQPIGDMDFSNMPDFSQIDLTNLQVPNQMPMTQDLPEVAPIEMMPQMRMSGMQDMQPRMMMAEGDEAVRGLMAAGSIGSDTSIEQQSPDMLALVEMARNAETPEEVQEIFKLIDQLREMEGRPQLAEGGEPFPDLSGDGQITRKDILIGQGVKFKAEGGEMMTQENEIDAMLGGMDSEEAGAMEDLEQMAPEMEMIDQLVTMVVQMIQQGASEEEVIMFLREQGLDDEDIGTVLQLVAEMAEAEAMPQDGIGAELEQLV